MRAGQLACDPPKGKRRRIAKSPSAPSCANRTRASTVSSGRATRRANSRASAAAIASASSSALVRVKCGRNSSSANGYPQVSKVSRWRGLRRAGIAAQALAVVERGAKSVERAHDGVFEAGEFGRRRDRGQRDEGAIPSRPRSSRRRAARPRTARRAPASAATAWKSSSTLAPSFRRNGALRVAWNP